MKLLVSPRDIEEARRSLAADIIDVKNPAEGSLGANFPWVIRSIRALTEKPVSAAIGDFDFRPGGAALAAYGAACAGVDYVKVGLMFDGRDRAAALASAVVKAVKGEFPTKKVVIAAYSDFLRLSTIPPLETVKVAAEAGADVVMVDTGRKDGQSTFRFMDDDALTGFVATARDLGLETAIAGALRFEDIERLRRINPSIIGVRGMVCGGDRAAGIREELVLELQRMVA
jgi:uncharacterized protein (UPF0264 family)